MQQQSGGAAPMEKLQRKDLHKWAVQVTRTLCSQLLILAACDNVLMPATHSSIHLGLEFREWRTTDLKLDWITHIY